MTTCAAVILAAGMGVRMNSQIPKVLHRVCGKEMVKHVVECVNKSDIPHVSVVVQPDSKLITDLLGNAVSYVTQPTPLGTGHALLQTKSKLTEIDTLVVLSGDVPLLSPDTLKKMVQSHKNKNACITVLTSSKSNPTGMGRIIRSSKGEFLAIVEENEADENILKIEEFNSGIYCFATEWLWDNLKQIKPSEKGEFYLTDLVSAASNQGMIVETIQPDDPLEVHGINTRVELAQAETEMRKRINEYWMLSGVTIPDPSSVYIDDSVTLHKDSIVMPNTHILGNSEIGYDCTVGPNSIISDSTVGNNCKIVSSVIEESSLSNSVMVGPFSHIRPGCKLDDGVRIGNFGEIKNSRLGKGTKSGHFCYIGDADLGSDVNIGAGVVTCNYDSHSKHRTTIGNSAFIGSDSMLVAPIILGDNSSTGTGSIVTKDVPENSIAVGSPARILSKKTQNKPDSKTVNKSE